MRFLIDVRNKREIENVEHEFRNYPAISAI